MEFGERLNRAMALHRDGRYEEALAVAEDVLSGRTPLPYEQEALAARMICVILVQNLRKPSHQALMAAQRAMRALRRVEHPVFRARTTVDCSFAAIASRQYEQAIRWLNWAESDEVPAEPAWRLYHNLAWVQLLQANYGRAREHSRRAIELAPAELEPRIDLALIEISQDRPAAAMRAIGELEEACSATDTRTRSYLAWISGWAFAQAGYMKDAEHRLNHAMTLAQMDGNWGLMAGAAATMTWIVVQDGDVEAALQFANTAQRYSERAGRFDLWDLVERQIAPLWDRQTMKPRGE